MWFFTDAYTPRFSHLQNNGIASVAAGAFSGFDKVNILRLFANKFTTLGAGMFSGLTSLHTLYVNNNPLVSIESGVFADQVGTLATIFAKQCVGLRVIEDNSINALTSRPLYVDMDQNPSICAMAPSNDVECLCADGMAPTATEGYCIETTVAAHLSRVVDFAQNLLVYLFS